MSFRQELLAATDPEAQGQLVTIAERYFGSTNVRLVEAVGAFVDRSTGSGLDLAALELAAASSSAIGTSTDEQANAVAGLIESLPVTAMPMAVSEIDLPTARQWFHQALSTPDARSADGDSHGPDILVGLVRSLIVEGTTRSLELSPATRATPSAAAMVRTKLNRDLRRGNLDAVESALSSPYLDARLWSIAARRVLRLRADTERRSALLASVAQSAPADADADMLSDLAEHVDFRAKTHLASHPNASPDLLAQFAMDPSSHVRAAAARHATERRVLERLAVAPESIVQQGAAANVATPPELLVALTSDDDPEVSHKAIRNPALPEPVLERFARDPDVAKRASAAANPACEQPLLALAEDPAPIVRARVAMHPASAALAILEQLASDDDPMVRMCVADNANAPASLLHELANDDDGMVRRAVASNKNTDIGTVESMGWDRDLWPTIDERCGGTFQRIERGDRSDLADLDPHEAHELATDPRAHGLQIVEHLSLAPLRETAETVHAGAALPEPEGLRNWSQLPSLLDAQFPIPVDVRHLESTRICGLTGVIARSRRDLLHLHARMGNCLDQYGDMASHGDIVIVSYDDPANDEIIAVGYSRRSNGTYRIHEANSKHNKERFPQGFLDDVRQLANTLHLPYAPPTTKAPARARRRRHVAVVENGPDNANETPSTATEQPQPQLRGRPLAQRPLPQGRAGDLRP